MLLMFTDFGAEGPYLGQMEAVLRRQAPGLAVINLLSNAPADPRRAGYLLAALRLAFPPASVFVCVVDPGVGGARRPLVLEADGQYFIGPDNGLLNPTALQAGHCRWCRIDWRPSRLSASFHGRDLFAPVAAAIASGDLGKAGSPCPAPDLGQWPADLAELVYCDHYGNLFTGWRYHTELQGKILAIGGHRIAQAGTFCEVPAGTPLWYRNSCGLVEIAVNRGRADRLLQLAPGEPFCFL